ncbi:lipid asymmetry maintenance protein MlaB [Photobacterium sp. TY1-4]|uniref:STAS domain-containing protein n=1 Tax=Photobacterium sp. TY1-4 TaxID=2899122 RepID=UPI0021C070B4|nr:STAS domain-containing protein [Photobacterium sp. TY1-4]UXI03834.1 STAS domain-containing protein [Photobacterium sp. TY1-4]
MSFSLGTNLDITQVIELQQQYLAFIRQEPQWQVDGGEVCRVDTAGLQLLLSLFATVDPAERRVRWLSYSSALLDAAVCAGLDEALGMKKV